MSKTFDDAYDALWRTWNNAARHANRDIGTKAKFMVFANSLKTGDRSRSDYLFNLRQLHDINSGLKEVLIHG
jgi:hypothetical protein